MALLCAEFDSDQIKLLGRWHSDAMIRYLHQEAQHILQQISYKMFNSGRYTFLTTNYVPSRYQLGFSYPCYAPTQFHPWCYWHFLSALFDRGATNCQTLAPFIFSKYVTRLYTCSTSSSNVGATESAGCQQLGLHLQQEWTSEGMQVSISLLHY